MTVILCPPPSIQTLDPDWEVPHPGFGFTELLRNDDAVWYAIDSEDCDALTLRRLADWCDPNARWTLDVNGPMVREIYELHRVWRLPDLVEWRLVERKHGFA